MARRRRSTTTRVTTPEQRRRSQARKRRRRDHKGMDKEDTMIANGYRLAIANDPCYYCGEYREVMHTDHFWALARGGTSHWYNLVRACAPCNYAKKTKCGSCYQGTPCKRRCRWTATLNAPVCVAFRVTLVNG